jgi:hypothetical protein
MSTSTLLTLTVRTFVLAVFASLFAAACLAQSPGSPVAGAAPFGNLTFDERGASLLNNLPNPNPVFPNLSGGLQFVLPFPVNPGQVLITLPSDVNNSNPNGDSDLLTFSNATNSVGVQVGVMLYESLFDKDAFDLAAIDPADVQRLSYVVPFNGVTILENGVEGNNNFTWVAGGNTYFGLSDGYLPTPEPSTFVLSALALAGLAAMAYRRRAARAC